MRCRECRGCERALHSEKEGAVSQVARDGDKALPSGDKARYRRNRAGEHLYEAGVLLAPLLRYGSRRMLGELVLHVPPGEFPAVDMDFMGVKKRNVGSVVFPVIPKLRHQSLQCSRCVRTYHSTKRAACNTAP